MAGVAMMKTLIQGGMGVALFVLFCMVSLAGETNDLPKFTGKELPEPPMQHAAWKAPETTLPTNLVSAAETLFQLGMVDPRGCEYREIEVVVGSVWGRATTMQVHGWVLPSQKGENQPFAASWAGTVYPVVRVGEKADVRKDIEALLRANEAFKEKNTSHRFISILLPSLHEYGAIMETNMMAMKAALLLQIGEERLAEKYWESWTSLGREYQDQEEINDPFKTLATEWSWAVFDRMLCAYMRGDDRLALVEGRRLDKLQPKLEAEMDRRGFKRQHYFEQAREDLEMPHFDFLEPLSKLLPEMERREKEGIHKTVFDIGIDQFPEKKKRIAALIHDLEEVNARQSSQPGGVWFGDDKVVKALIEEGDDAVEPLLDCLENDQRLTRSVQFHRDFKFHREVLPVQRAAQTALDEILKMSFKTPAEYRAYWEKQKNVSLTERWYWTLKDDKAGRKQWLQAAKNILSRTDGKTVYLWRNAPVPNSTNGYTYVAKELRTRTNPTVVEIFMKRALEIAPKDYGSSEDCWTFQGAAELGLMAAEWDEKAAKEGVAEILARCPALNSKRQEWSTGCAVVPEYFAQLVDIMAKAGDTKGLDLYAKWLGDREFSDLEDALPRAWAPLWTFPEHPSIKEVSGKLFADSARDWMKSSRARAFLKSKMLRNGAFRASARKLLDDKSEAGHVVLKEGNGIEINYGDSNFFSSGVKADAFAPKLGEAVSFRVCDSAAHELARIEGLPKLELYWPESKRDETLIEIKKFLDEKGNDIRLTPGDEWPPEDWQ
jgi:hypothetical protein